MKKFWLLPILFLISAPAFASQPYDIYAYWDIDELYMVFNGIASIIGAADFLGLLKTVMFVGVLVAMFSFLGTQQFDGWNWFLSAMFIYTLLFLPVATVVIQDRTGTQPPKTVDNIPVSLAMMASLTSHAGDYMTRGFEAVFSVLPDDLKFQKHDLGFGHRVIKESRRMTIADPELRADVIQFIKNCTLVDLAQGRIAYKDIYGDPTPGAVATQPWDKMWDNTSSAHMTMYRSLSGAKIGYCNDVAKGGGDVAITDSLKYRLAFAVDAAQKYYGRVLNPDVTDDNIAGALLASQMPNAFQVMLGMSQGASDLIKQNMFVNIWQESGSAIPAMMGDTAAVQMALASAQAAAAANSSYKVGARLAESTMPMFRNVIELTIYAVFPFIIVFAVAAGNQSKPILKGYFMSMVWVQLWAPIYAVVNLIGTMDGATKLKAVTMATHGLAVQTAGALDEALISHQSMMGYIAAVAAPTIALALTKGGEMAMNSMTGKASAPVEQAATTAGSEVGKGNSSLGQMSMDNLRANMNQSNSWDKPGSFTQKDASGNEHSVSADGTHRVKQNLSSLAVKPDFAHSVNKQLGISRDEHAANAQKYATEGASQLSSGASEAWGYAKKHVKGSDSATDWHYGDKLTLDEKMSRVKGFTEEFAADHKVKSQDVFKAATSIGAGIGYGQFSANIKATGETMSMDEKTYTELRKTMEKNEISNVAGVTSDWARQHDFKTTDGDSSRGHLRKRNLKYAKPWLTA